MLIGYELPPQGEEEEEGYTTVEIDVDDVLTLAMEHDPRRLASMITELMRTEYLTFRTMMSDSQKEDLREAVEVINHV